MSRELPANAQAEQAVLGSALIEPALWRRVSDLTPDDFSLPAHRLVFEAMGRAAGRGLAIEAIAVADEMRSPTGTSQLIELMAAVGSLELLPQQMRIVREKATARRAIATLGEATASLFLGDEPAKVLEQLAAAVSALATGTSTDLIRLGDCAKEAIDEIERRAIALAEAKTDAPLGIRFGVRAIDDVLNGLQPGDQCVVAADVGGGKSALAVQAALTSTLVDGGTAIVFSLEMSRRQLAERALAHLGKINSHLLRRGQIDRDQFRTLHSVIAKVYEAPLYLEDKAFRLRDLTARARAWRARHPNKRGVMVVDFVQLVRAEGVRGENRARELGRTAYALKELAKELEVSSIVLSQLNRGPAKSDMPPTKHDLKESGDIEASADQIVLLHNPGKTDDGPVDVIVDKNRHGIVAVVSAHWTGRYFCFGG